MPERVPINIAKCAIVRACSHDPLVQRANAKCTTGYCLNIGACLPHDPQKTGVPRKFAS